MLPILNNANDVHQAELKPNDEQKETSNISLFLERSRPAVCVRSFLSLALARSFVRCPRAPCTTQQQLQLSFFSIVHNIMNLKMRTRVRGRKGEDEDEEEKHFFLLRSLFFYREMTRIKEVQSWKEVSDGAGEMHWITQCCCWWTIEHLIWTSIGNALCCERRLLLGWSRLIGNLTSCLEFLWWFVIDCCRWGWRWEPTHAIYLWEQKHVFSLLEK